MIGSGKCTVRKIMKHRELSSERTESQHERLSRFPVYPHFYASKEARPMRTATLCSSAHLQFAPDDRADPRLFGAPGPTWTGAPPAWTSLTATTMEMCSHEQFSRIHGQFGFFLAKHTRLPSSPYTLKNGHVIIGVMLPGTPLLYG